MGLLLKNLEDSVHVTWLTPKCHTPASVEAKIPADFSIIRVITQSYGKQGCFYKLSCALNENLIF